MNQAFYPIREVARLTGINPITLRAWERRYELISPVRTESGHRLYTEQHIDLVKQALALTDQGIPISRVKQLLNEPQQPNLAQEKTDFQHNVIETLKQFKADQLEQTLDQLFIDLSDQQAYVCLKKVTLEFDFSAAQQGLWQSTLLPRLAMRLRQLQRQLPAHAPSVWIQSDQAQQAELLWLDALEWAQKGYRPLMQTQAFLSPDEITSELKSCGCQQLSLITTQPHFVERDWQNWVQNHSDCQLQISSLTPISISAPNATGSLLLPDRTNS